MAKNPFFFGSQKGDKRAADLDNRLAADLPSSPSGTRSGADPTSAQTRARNQFGRGPFLTVGRVIDAIAYAHFYKVQLSDGLGTVRCCAGTQTSLRVTGPRQVNSYGPGDAVMVAYDPKGAFHYILCAVPDWLFDARAGVSDQVVQGSNVGLQSDQVHQYPYLTTGKGGIIDFSAGRPGDSLPGQEWGAISEHGLRILIDAMMAQVAVDEETGLFVFWWDQMTRLAGHNLQIRSSGHEREDLDDESEFSSVTGWNPYPWEVLGSFAPNDVPAVELTASDVQQGSRFRTRLEPVSDDQLAIFRELDFHGYLGQGGKQMIVGPDGTGVQTYAKPSNLWGLAEVNRGLDGSIFTRSAHSVLFAKMPWIPGPKRKNRPESFNGDRTDNNYASCGQFGAGPAHAVQDSPSNSNSTPHVVESAAILDQAAYAFNWKGAHPFHYHNADWYLDQESDIAAFTGITDASVPFADLETTHALPRAPYYEVTVDDRYGAVKYYANVAFFGLLPSGGFSAVDGWGSEQRMVAGNGEYHVPGDLIFTAGRNIVFKAGHNVAIEGLDSVEVVGSTNDVRILAGRKAMLSGGNQGEGGVLIESRATETSFTVAASPGDEDCISGIVIKSNTAAMHVSVQDFDLKTTTGSILLDAFDHIATKSKQFRRHLTECAIDFSSSGVIAEWWPNQARIVPDLVAHNDVYAGGNMAVVGVGVFGPSVRALAVKISPGSDATLLSSITTSISDRDLSSERTESLDEITWFVDNSDVEDLEFYFQTPASHLATDFEIVEPVWHQLARQSGQTMPTWTETAVGTANHDDTAPFPGYDAWFTQNGYGKQDSSFFDPTTNTAVDRDSSYETPALAATAWVTLNTNWPIIKLPN